MNSDQGHNQGHNRERDQERDQGKHHGHGQDDEVRRLRKRVPFETTITIEYDDKTVEYKHSYDISMNGVFIRTGQTLPVGTRGSFTMKLSMGMRAEWITGQCEVIRSVSLDDGLSEEDPGPGIGVKFIDLEPESSRKLYHVIRYNQPA